VTHIFFVSAAYIISAVVIGGMVMWILADQAARKRELADLERRGVKRRSAEPKP
jgi:heme exporter protein D